MDDLAVYSCSYQRSVSRQLLTADQEVLVAPVRNQRLWQLSEVEFQQWSHRVDVCSTAGKTQSKPTLKNMWSTTHTETHKLTALVHCTCRRRASPRHRKPPAALWPDWPVPTGETSPPHAGHAPWWRSHTAPPPEEPNEPRNAAHTAPSPPNADQKPLQGRKNLMSQSSPHPIRNKWLVNIYLPLTLLKNSISMIWIIFI